MHFQALTPQELFEQDRKTLAPRLPRGDIRSCSDTIAEAQGTTPVIRVRVSAVQPLGSPSSTADRMGL